MTIPNWGSVSSSDVRRQLYDPSNGEVSTVNDNVRRLVKKTSGITFPDDFYGKGWGQQMNALTESNVNVGDSSNMRPHLMDRRVDGSTNPIYNFHRLDSSKSWFGGVYMYNTQNAGPVEYAWNGYFVQRTAIGSSTTGSVNYESKWVYGPGYIRISMNLIGFSAGYLSGNRQNLALANKNNADGTGTLSPYGNSNSSYPHICVNLSAWTDASGATVEVYFWDGWAR